MFSGGDDALNWSQRYKANLEKLASGDLVQVVEVVRDLTGREASYGLSAGEKRMLAKARLIQDAAQGVDAGPAVRLVGGAAAAAGQDRLGLVELLPAEGANLVRYIRGMNFPVSGKFPAAKGSSPRTC